MKLYYYINLKETLTLMAKVYFDRAGVDHANALQQIGILYEYGHGVIKNIDTALIYYYRALSLDTNNKYSFIDRYIERIMTQKYSVDDYRNELSKGIVYDKLVYYLGRSNIHVIDKISLIHEYVMNTSDKNSQSFKDALDLLRSSFSIVPNINYIPYITDYERAQKEGGIWAGGILETIEDCCGMTLKLIRKIRKLKKAMKRLQQENADLRKDNEYDIV